MNAIGWAIYAWAEAGEWMLLPLGLAAAWASYRLTTRAIRRAAARRAERNAHWQHLTTEARAKDTAALNPDQHPGTNTHALAECEAIYQLPDARKETQ